MPLFFAYAQSRFSHDMALFTFSYPFQIRTYAAALCIDTKFKGGNDNFGLAPCIKDGQGGGEQVCYCFNKPIKNTATFRTVKIDNIV